MVVVIIRERPSVEGETHVVLSKSHRYHMEYRMELSDDLKQTLSESCDFIGPMDEGADMMYPEMRNWRRKVVEESKKTHWSIVRNPKDFSLVS